METRIAMTSLLSSSLYSLYLSESGSIGRAKNGSRAEYLDGDD